MVCLVVEVVGQEGCFGENLMKADQFAEVTVINVWNRFVIVGSREALDKICQVLKGEGQAYREACVVRYMVGCSDRHRFLFPG